MCFFLLSRYKIAVHQQQKNLKHWGRRGRRRKKISSKKQSINEQRKTTSKSEVGNEFTTITRLISSNTQKSLTTNLDIVYYILLLW